jgi:hypothetical protein
VDDVDCAKRKIEQLGSQIRSLRASDFHHPRIKTSLELIERVFDRDLRLVEGLDPEVALHARQSVCSLVNRDLARFHRVLGIILRSTNPRNSFEIFDPLLRIAKDLSGDDTMLILSAEWEFSPFADPSVVTELENYVLVGLPVSEAANSLIVPLAGHELGHSVWREKDIARELRSRMQLSMVKQLTSSATELGKKIEDVPADLSEFLRKDRRGLFALGALERICEEIFCDFMGIRVFGDSYLGAFMYLVSPNVGVTDQESYPTLDNRASYMSYARRKLGVRTLKLQVPIPFSRWFTEPPEDETGGDDQLTYSDAELFLLGETHRVARSLLPEILALARRECDKAQLPLPARGHAEQVFARLRSHVPAERVRKRGIADVINAGWMAFLDKKLWPDSDRKFEAINELIFKSLDVMEFEERINAVEGGPASKANPKTSA